LHVKKFDRLIFDLLSIRNRDMTLRSIKSVYDETFSIDGQVLSRICEKIVCRIHHQVTTLTIKSYSTKRILLAVNYPQLYSLSFIDFEEKILYEYLISTLIDFSNLVFEQKYRNHIVHLPVTSFTFLTFTKLKIYVDTFIECLLQILAVYQHKLFLWK
jgi:hypothetical protein